jgi:DNA-binding NtrC family response regulator
MSELMRHSWDGNIRELRNHLERCVALGRPLSLGGMDEPAINSGPTEAIDLNLPLKLAREVWINDFERKYLSGLLERHGGRVSTAARAAGVDRVYFYRLLWKHGLRERDSA